MAFAEVRTMRNGRKLTRSAPAVVKGVLPSYPIHDTPRVVLTIPTAYQTRGIRFRRFGSPLRGYFSVGWDLAQIATEVMQAA
jgi:hypothetical protein